MNFVIRWLITAVAAGFAIWIVPGITMIGGFAWGAVAAFALVLALVDMSIKPVMQILSMPISILTLGVFYLVVNTLMLYLARWISNGIFGTGIEISSFGAAFVAAIVISIVGSVLNGIIDN